ncbi:hypothetical protein RHSIM_Rhsim13G0125100 [Rhododendron simsii]|uniref:Transposase n=1 Tax=Rhododendron simsii TaxID=118357 RepID=A0A834L686_RHOSS|nr:hypothetical protein RHSIM_Rhsim13G0125100 [Rhododendron simsii]
MEGPRFVLGLIFPSATVFKDAIKQYAIKNQKNVKIVKNDKKRVRVKCEAGCPWVIYPRKVLGEESYQVRTFKNKHKCGVSYTNRNINSAMIAKKYMLDLRSNPSMPITSFKETVRKELKVDVSKSQLYGARRKAALLIYGNDIAQYGMLCDFCEELRRSNPGSTVVMDAPLDEETGQPRFNRLYICLAACKSGFIHGCRKLIGVDGCHLKGPFEKENTDTWSWFFQLLGLDLGITPTNEHEFTFINDRQKGLQAALDNTCPSAEHRHCCKHLLSNFMKTYKGLALEETLWKCAKATHVAQFQHAMECMKEENVEAYVWLTKEPARALLHFLDPHKFKSKDDFVQNYKNLSSFNEIELANLHMELRPHILQRVIKDVEKSLPPKIERILQVEMSPLQKQYYKWILERNFNDLNKGVRGNQVSLLNIVVELKKCCNHPFLFESANHGYGGDTNITGLFSETIFLDVNMVRMLDLVAEYLSLRGFQYQRLDVSTEAELCQQAMEHFNAPDSDDSVSFFRLGLVAYASILRQLTQLSYLIPTGILKLTYRLEKKEAKKGSSCDKVRIWTGMSSVEANPPERSNKRKKRVEPPDRPKRCKADTSAYSVPAIEGTAAQVRGWSYGNIPKRNATRFFRALNAEIAEHNELREKELPLVQDVDAKVKELTEFIPGLNNHQMSLEGPKLRRAWMVDMVSRNDDAVQNLPIYVDGISLLAVLINHDVSGIPPDVSRRSRYGYLGDHDGLLRGLDLKSHQFLSQYNSVGVLI